MGLNMQNDGPKDLKNEADSGIKRSPGIDDLSELLEMLNGIHAMFNASSVTLSAPAPVLNFGAGLPVPHFGDAQAPLVPDEDDRMSVSPSTSSANDFEDEGEDFENISSAGNTPKNEYNKRARTDKQSAGAPKKLNFQP